MIFEVEISDQAENFSGKLVENSIIYADGTFCYDQLAEKSHCTLVQLKTRTSYNTVEYINTVNYIHSLIKRQLASFRGVATKYMNRYMSLFVYLRRFQEMDDNEMMPIILIFKFPQHFTISRIALKKHKLALF